VVAVGLCITNIINNFLGTDCQDCGPVGADNFTRADDDGWWDDDDDYWTFNDGNFLGIFIILSLEIFLIECHT